MKKITVIVCMVFALNLSAQNLVPNGSFEEYNFCPQVLNCDIGSVPFWQWSKSGLAYANLCYFSDTAQASCAAPFSTGGGGCFQYPQDGNGHALVEVASNSGSYYRNQVQTKLIKPLDSAQCYYFSMYISLCDSCGYGTDDIGVLFRPTFTNLNGPNPVEIFPAPQIFYGGEFISDKVNWIHYTGSFDALGGEQYMIIGSMSHPDSIQFTSLPTGISWLHKSSYFIDNISLLECEEVGINENPSTQTNLYPNPTTGIAYTDKPATEACVVAVYDAQGRLVFSQNYGKGISRAELNLSGQPQGLYFCRLLYAGGRMESGRLVVVE